MSLKRSAAIKNEVDDVAGNNVHGLGCFMYIYFLAKQLVLVPVEKVIVGQCIRAKKRSNFFISRICTCCTQVCTRIFMESKICFYIYKLWLQLTA